MEKEYQEYLQEIFALPINLYPAVEFDGLKLYSSDDLKRKYTEVLHESTRTDKIADDIKKLVDKNKVIPVFITKGLFSFFAYKLLAGPGLKNIMGFYSPPEDVIVLLIDNNVNIIGSVSTDRLCTLSVHELSHMACQNLKGSYYKTVEKYLSKYYMSLFNQVFSLDNKSVDIEPVVKFIYNKIEMKHSLTNELLDQYDKLLKATFEKDTSFTKKEFEDRVYLYRVCIVQFVNDLSKFIRNYGYFRPIVQPMYNAYETAFGISKSSMHTVCVQELLYPSEVICVATEFHKIPEIFDMVRKLS